MEENNVNPDKYLWGIFYYDPDDRRVFVPKFNRWMGYTVNFASPYSWIVIQGIILFSILINFLDKN